MSNSLAIAMGVRSKNKYAKGGMVSSAKPEQEAMDYEESIEDELPSEPAYHAELPSQSKSGMLSASKLVSGIRAKKMGKMNQGDNMPVNEDIDMLSAETSTEGPLGEGEYEPNRQDKILMRKSMLNKIMSRLHSDNKGA